ncbi:MAG: fumarate hydratase [Actinomycetota bacterium]
MPKARELDTSEIASAVSHLVQEANFELPDDIVKALKKALDVEESPLGRDALETMLENAMIAAGDTVPLCQDTGVTVVFIELGQGVLLTGEPLEAAVNAGVRSGCEEGFLRKSVVAEPLHERINTGDNTPAVIHLESAPGDKVKITVFVKGGGSETAGAAKVIRPAEGLAAVKEFILEQAELFGPNACPPVIVGVGVGGTLDKAAELAKKALLKPLDEVNPDERLAALEEELKLEINKMGFGPAGTGGRVSCLGVRILTHPSHIATIPVAVDISCYALRRKSVTL